MPLFADYYIVEMPCGISDIYVPAVLNPIFACHRKLNPGNQMVYITAAKIRAGFPCRFHPGVHSIRIRCINHNCMAIRLLICPHNIAGIFGSQRRPNPVSPYPAPRYTPIFQMGIRPATVYNNIRLVHPQTFRYLFYRLKIHTGRNMNLAPVLPPNLGCHPGNIHIAGKLFFIPPHHINGEPFVLHRQQIIQQIIAYASKAKNHHTDLPVIFS